LEPRPPPQPWRFMQDHSGKLLVLVFVLSVIWSMLSLRVELDSRVFSFVDKDSAEYGAYQRYVDGFGSDQVLFLLVESRLPASDPLIYDAFPSVLQGLTSLREVVSVDSLYTMAPFFSSFIPGLKGPWAAQGLQKLRSRIPYFKYFLSEDLHLMGIAVHLAESHPQGASLERLVDAMGQVITSNFPGQPVCRAVGFSVMLAAFERHNLRNAIQFSLISFLVGTLIALYIFKSLRVSLLVMISCLFSMVWTLGIMGVFNIPLSLASGLSFGFIMVICTMTVMHIYTQYHDMHDLWNRPHACLACAFGVVARPCFMCALTTATGFFTLMFSPLEMIRQAGFVMGTGALCGFAMAVLVSYYLIPRFANPGPKVQRRIQGDMVQRLTGIIGHWGTGRPRLALTCGLVFVGCMLIGAVQIHMSSFGMDALSQGVRESQDLDLMNRRLLPMPSFSLVFEPLTDKRDTDAFWRVVENVESSLRADPQVMRVESLLGLSQQISALIPTIFAGPDDIRRELFNNDKFHSLRMPLYEPKAGWYRLTVTLNEEAGSLRFDLMNRILTQTRKAASDVARVELHGYQALMDMQMRGLLIAQLESLAAALALITVLMCIQLGSLTLGLISLIPNLLPLAAIFGLMGFLHIPLDPLTAFAAVISFGLSVDDTIHYLTQLKRELTVSGGGLGSCVRAAYTVTARALISTTAVLTLSCVALFFSPFTHIRSLGILIGGASLVALLGDLVVMPAAILGWKPIGRSLLKLQPQAALSGSSPQSPQTEGPYSSADAARSPDV
jgi:uncharacterized protein